jgi:hypothetical protein
LACPESKLPIKNKNKEFCFHSVPVLNPIALLTSSRPIKHMACYAWVGTSTSHWNKTETLPFQKGVASKGWTQMKQRHSFNTSALLDSNWAILFNYENNNVQKIIFLYYR